MVPLALIAEWLAHSALHANPGLALHGMDNLRLFNGIALDSQKRIIQLLAGKASRNGQVYEVDVEIRDDARDTTSRVHSSAKAILTDRLPAPPLFEENGHFRPNGHPPSIDDIYDRTLDLFMTPVGWYPFNSHCLLFHVFLRRLSAFYFFEKYCGA